MPFLDTSVNDEVPSDMLTLPNVVELKSLLPPEIVVVPFITVLLSLIAPPPVIVKSSLRVAPSSPKIPEETTISPSKESESDKYAEPPAILRVEP